MDLSANRKGPAGINYIILHPLPLVGSNHQVAGSEGFFKVLIVQICNQVMIKVEINKCSKEELILEGYYGNSVNFQIKSIGF